MLTVVMNSDVKDSRSLAVLTFVMELVAVKKIVASIAMVMILPLVVMTISALGSAMASLDVMMDLMNGIALLETVISQVNSMHDFIFGNFV